MRTSRKGGVVWKLPAHRVQGSSCPGWRAPGCVDSGPPQPSQMAVATDRWPQMDHGTDRWQSLIQQARETEYAVAQQDLPSACCMHDG